MRMRKKADLPEKICAHCGRPFSWRKKWARTWDEVKYCSDRCRGERNQAPNLVCDESERPGVRTDSKSAACSFHQASS
jgi:hypothetical protein